MVLSNRDGANIIIPTAARIGATTRGGQSTSLTMLTTAQTYINMGWDFNNVWTMDPTISDYPVLRSFIIDPPPSPIIITPGTSELIGVNASELLTASSADPTDLPSNWDWTATPAGFVDLVGSGNSRTITVTNPPPRGSVYVTVTVTSPSGAEGHAEMRVVSGGGRPCDIFIAAVDTVQLGRWLDDNLQSSVWNSSIPAVATIDAGGVVIGRNVGITEIYTDDFEINVRVTGRVVPTGISIETPDDDFLFTGEEMDLTAYFTPDNARDMHIVWHSSNPNVVSIGATSQIDKAVTIHGVGVGRARITATVVGLDIYAYIYIDVRQLSILANWDTFVDRDIVPGRFHTGDANSGAFIEGVGLTHVGVQDFAPNPSQPPANDVLYGYGWNDSTSSNPKAWLAVIPAAGYTNFEVSFLQRANAASPNTFTFQFSFNGTDWVDVETYQIWQNWQPGQAPNQNIYFNPVSTDILITPASPLTGNLYLRWVAGSDRADSTSTVGPGAHSFIRNIEVTGQRVQ